MKTWQWTLVIIGVIALVLFLLWLFFPFEIKPLDEKETDTTQPKTPAQPNTPYCETVGGLLNETLVMRITAPLMKAKEICFVQKLLNKEFNAGLKEDGIFGPKTYAAVKEHLKYKSGFTLRDIAAQMAFVKPGSEVTINMGNFYG